MESNKNYELFLVALPIGNTTEQFYEFMNNYASDVPVAAIAIEDATREEIEKLVFSIMKEGVKANGFKAE